MSAGPGGIVSKNVSGFTQFLNDFGIRAFDELAARRAVAEPGSSEEPSPLDRLAARWSSLDPEEKQEVIKRLLLAGSAVGAAVPAIARARRAAKTRKAKSRATKAPSAPAGDAVPDEPGRKRGAANPDKKKNDRAKKEEKRQKKLLKQAEKKEKKERKRKKKDEKKAR